MLSTLVGQLAVDDPSPRAVIVNSSNKADAELSWELLKTSEEGADTGRDNSPPFDGPGLDPGGLREEALSGCCCPSVGRFLEVEFAEGCRQMRTLKGPRHGTF